MKDVYCFPAIFNCTNEGISVAFPDLQGCVTCADDYAEALYMAHDCLGGWLYTSERDNEFIPEPSDPLKLKENLKENQLVVPIEVCMLDIRSKFDDDSKNDEHAIREKLKPCPFCGNHAIEVRQMPLINSMSIYCDTCGALVFFGDEVEDFSTIRKKWNRRVDNGNRPES